MWYVYVLQSLKNRRLYVGITNDIKQRIIEHNSGNGGKFTHNNRPYKLIFYEGFTNKKDAIIDERFFKSGYGKEILKEKIKNSLK